MIDDYFNGVIDVLAQPGAIDAYVTISVVGNQGWLDATLVYPHALFLDIALTVEDALGHYAWKSYSFHFRSALGSCVFRYDMAPHHPEIPTHPHHKHEGSDERVLPASQPTPRQIQNELIEYLDVLSD